MEPTSTALQSISSFGLSLCLTYLAHAVVWAAVAALGARWRRLSFAARHRCWKAALFGPLLSASLASAWSGAQSAAERDSRQELAATSSQAVVSALTSATPRSWLRRVDISVRSATPSASSLAWVAAVASGLGLLRFGASAAALRRRLRGRKNVTEPRVLRHFDELVARMALANVRLTECEGLPGPLVVGGREVCVPLGVFDGSCDEDMDAVLAHELAHIERGDGVWFPLVGAVQYTLWFQPLNHLVSSYVRSSAELSCDDRAVELTQNPKALGRALVRLAEAARHLPGSALAPSIVRKESDLLPRVRRLVAARGERDERSARRGYWGALVGAALVGAALVTLSVRVVRAQRLPSPTSSSPRAAAVAGVSDEAGWSSLAPQNARMAELAARDQQLTAALAQLSEDPAAARADTREFTRELELRQELRHVRATQEWLEQTFVATWSTGDHR